MAIALVLVAIEIAFSFDNAVVNAQTLVLLNPFWQRMFLTVGVVLAIFGMRLVFPIAIVAITAHLPWLDVWNLALHQPSVYAAKLSLAAPSIEAFGGAFLLMLSLHFFVEDREVQWLRRFERPLGHYGGWWLPSLGTVLLLVLLALMPTNDHAAATLQAGLAGVLTYLAVYGFIRLVEIVLGQRGTGTRVGWAAFATFLYLQLLDASFSFDSVIGAFAITNKVVLIAIGLGIGAVWVRSLTVMMVRRRTLQTYRYLEHGAHYAVLTLAAAMLLSEFIDIPNLVSGVTGMGIIAASVIASVQYNRGAAEREQRAR